MKVTSFYPVLVVHEFNNEVEAHLEAMGMKMIHRVEMTFRGVDFIEYTYKNESGQRLSVSVADDSRPEGIYSMHVNVDNFEEGVAYFKEKGYINSSTAEPIELPDRIMYMRTHKDCERDVIYVVHHKRKQ